MCEENPHLNTVLVLHPPYGWELGGIFKQSGKTCNYVQERQEIPNRSANFLTLFKPLSFAVTMCRLSSFAACTASGFAVNLYCSKESDRGMGRISCFTCWWQCTLQ